MDPLNTSMLTTVLAALLGALGAYLATTLGARTLGRSRAEGLLRAIRAQVAEERSGRQDALERLNSTLTLTLMLLEALNASRADPTLEQAESQGIEVRLTDPAQWTRLIQGVLSVRVSAPLVSRWLPALTQDIEHLSPELYLTLSELEGVQRLNAVWPERILEHLYVLSDLQLEYRAHARTIQEHAARDLVQGERFTAALRRHLYSLDVFIQVQSTLDHALDKAHAQLEQAGY